MGGGCFIFPSRPQPQPQRYLYLKTLGSLLWGPGAGGGRAPSPPVYILLLSPPQVRTSKCFLADPIWSTAGQHSCSSPRDASSLPGCGMLPAPGRTPCKPSAGLIGWAQCPTPSPRPVPTGPLSSGGNCSQGHGGSNIIYYNKQGGPLTNRPT